VYDVHVDVRPESRDHLLKAAWWRGTVDARPLALFRVLYGCVVVIDLLDRMRDFAALYSDAGVLPRATWFWVERDTTWSLFNIAGAPGALSILWGLSLAAALALTFGWHTRLAALIHWALLLGLHWRNSFVVDGADGVMRVMAFWLLFADSGACFSLDARRDGRRSMVAALPVRMLHLQFAAIYLISVVMKLRTGPWRQGTALYRILQMRDFARPLGLVLGAHPSLCRALSLSTLAIEVAVPLVVLLPMRKWSRLLALLMCLGLHLGITLTMRVGLFCTVMPVCMTLFLPPGWLGRLGPDLRAPAPSASRAQLTLPLVFLAMLWTVFFPQPASLAEVIRSIGLQQRWRMFAGDVGGHDVFIYADAITAQGRRNLFAEVEPRRDALRYYFLTDRWNRLRNSMGHTQSAPVRRSLADYFCRRLASQGVTATGVVFAAEMAENHLPGEAPHPSDRKEIPALPCPSPEPR
jgi:hypothetical protein